MTKLSVRLSGAMLVLLCHTLKILFWKIRNFITDTKKCREPSLIRGVFISKSKLVSFVNGMVTDESDLLDEIYDDAGMHTNTGAWQMTFSVVTAPDQRRHGYAGQCLKEALAQAKAEKVSF